MSKEDKKDMSLIEKAAARLNSKSLQKPDQKIKDTPPETVATRESRPSESGPRVNIDLTMLKHKGFVTPDGERSSLSEEFRFIKRPLLENAFGKNSDLVEHGNMIMVTSAMAGEGKTWTTINLALSIAMELDKTVLLIDADVGRAQIHRVLGTPMGPGLIDLLTEDNLDVSDVILRTSVPKLRVIPMGRFHPHANELLAGENMLRLSQELANRYKDRIVIFDSPPLLMTSEAVVLSGLMGQIVFVVESERTRQSNVKEALALLDDSKPIGLVLNKVRRHIGQDYYGYGAYGYRESHGA